MIKVVLNADDGDVRVRIEAKVVTGLAEKDLIAKRLGRALADALRSLSANADFGPENTTISIV